MEAAAAAEAAEIPMVETLSAMVVVASGVAETVVGDASATVAAAVRGG